MIIKKKITTTTENVVHFLSMSAAYILLIFFPILAAAHGTNETSARITLRDGQVEVRIWLDMSRWHKRLQDNQAWLLGDIRQVMPAELTPTQTRAFVKNVLTDETSLTVNNQSVALILLTISEPKGNAKNRGYTEVVLSSKHQRSLVENVEIVFPISLGTVHASFVKPKYQMVAAGTKAQVSFPALVRKTPGVEVNKQDDTDLDSNNAKLAPMHTH